MFHFLCANTHCSSVTLHHTKTDMFGTFTKINVFLNPHTNVANINLPRQKEQIGLAINLQTGEPTMKVMGKQTGSAPQDCKAW